MGFCADSGGGSELERQFASLSLQAGGGMGTGTGEEAVTPASKQETPTTAMTTATTAAATTTTMTMTTAAASTAAAAPVAVLANSNAQSTEKTLSTLILAMRKLREGIIASNRLDDFSTRAYIFCIRATILMKHKESYHPALLHLLRIMDPRLPLPPTEKHEFVGYLLLDLACRQNDLAQAFAARNQHRYSDRRVDSVLRALAHDNYVLFWKVRGEVDGYQGGLMAFAEEEMRVLALKCLSRSYLCAERAFV
ncbi:hypothetical protein GP486_007696, partial [Trichoglossum hirsutum]